MEPSLLIYDDPARSPDLRHELPVDLFEPALYAEHEGRRILVTGTLDRDRIAAAAPDVDLVLYEDLGVDALLAAGRSLYEVELHCVREACNRLGITAAGVPHTFPLWLADELRAAGIELAVDRERFAARRRSKTPYEIAGIRRAQAAAEAAMAQAARLLAGAQIHDGILLHDGQPLTCEQVKAAMTEVITARGALTGDFIVATGAQGARGHDMGSGPIVAGRPLIVDVWPQDDETRCWADMTRTFCVGEIPAELAAMQALCLRVLEEARAMTRAGVDPRSVHVHASERFHAEGHPTQLHKDDGELLEDGFTHALGHGVGLEVHEDPIVGRAGSEALVAGDVLAVEPGLYRQGFGGCRLEDLWLVTEDGVEVLTDFPYDLDPALAAGRD